MLLGEVQGNYLLPPVKTLGMQPEPRGLRTEGPALGKGGLQADTELWSEDVGSGYSSSACVTLD